MIVVLVLFIVLVGFLIMCAWILWRYAFEVRKQEGVLREALWIRRNMLPLFLELISEDVAQPLPELSELINLRQKVMSQAYTLSEEVELERKISHLIHLIIQKTKDTPSLKTDARYLASERDLDQWFSGIRITLNNYNFSLQKWLTMSQLPWFKIFEFAFEIRKNKLLPLV